MKIILLLCVVVCSMDSRPAFGAEAASSQGPKSSQVAQEWSAIWKSKNSLKALNAFKEKHGLYLETSKSLGTDSFIVSEGPCGETYLSLVKDAKELTEKVWEIDTKGKILREWQPGTNEIQTIQGNVLYRQVVFFADVTDFNPQKKERNSETFDFRLAVTSKNHISVVKQDKPSVKWDITETKCPAGLKINSEFKYCVKDKQTKRTFVLQKACT